MDDTSEQEIKKSSPAYCCVPLCHMNADKARLEGLSMHR